MIICPPFPVISEHYVKIYFINFHHEHLLILDTIFPQNKNYHQDNAAKLTELHRTLPKLFSLEVSVKTVLECSRLVTPLGAPMAS